MRFLVPQESVSENLTRSPTSPLLHKAPISASPEKSPDAKRHAAVIERNTGRSKESSTFVVCNQPLYGT